MPLTWSVIVFFAVTFAVTDYLLWKEYGYRATVSGTLYYLSRNYPFVIVLVSVAVGYLLGHLFSPPPADPNPPASQLKISTGNYEPSRTIVRPLTLDVAPN